MPAPSPITSISTTHASASPQTQTLAGVTAGSTIVSIVATYRQDALVPHVTSIASSNGGALSVARTRTRNSQNAGGGNRLTLSVYTLANAAAGDHTLTLTKGQTGTTFGSWLSFAVPGAAPTSPLDIAIDASADHPAPTMSIGPTAGLAQAQQFALAIVAGLGTEIWNGSNTPPSVAPTGWVALRSWNTNTPLEGVPMQVSYQDVNSVAPLSATWTASTDTIDDGFLLMIVTIKLAAGGLFVEILLDPDPNASPPIVINNLAGWSVEMSAGDPGAGAQMLTNITAQPSGNKLHVPAPAGVALNQKVNVIAYNTGAGLSGERGVGTVKAS